VPLPSHPALRCPPLVPQVDVVATEIVAENCDHIAELQACIDLHCILVVLLDTISSLWGRWIAGLSRRAALSVMFSRVDDAISNPSNSPLPWSNSLPPAIPHSHSPSLCCQCLNVPSICAQATHQTCSSDPAQSHRQHDVDQAVLLR